MKRMMCFTDDWNVGGGGGGVLVEFPPPLLCVKLLFGSEPPPIPPQPVSASMDKTETAKSITALNVNLCHISAPHLYCAA